jgi:Ca2+-binding RTX toxin-like protein
MLKVKNNTYKLTTIITTLSLLIGTTIGFLDLGAKQTRVSAVGDLTIDWGVVTGDPIFTIVDMLPGDSQMRDVDITNNASVTRTLSLRSNVSTEPGNLADNLNLTISESGIDLYNDTLANFFLDTQSPTGTVLSDLPNGDSTSYKFTIELPAEAGEELESTNVTFDLTLGTAVETPSECGDLEIDGETIFGTENNDRLRGTGRNDLIFGLEGDDKIIGGSGEDCIVGGPGVDNLRGGSDSDLIFGGDDNDMIRGGSGDDTIFAGGGDDEVNGGSGEDTLNGEDGDDLLKGGSDADFLDGGAGEDEIDGDSDFDTCIGEFQDDCEF